jgi:transcriptional regulator with XRE-family HTH domain
MAKRSKVQIDHDEIMRLFAERLREVRQACGMAQAELARRADLTMTYVSRLESARVAPGIDLVGRLARALGVGIAALLPDAADADPLPVLKDQARQLLETLLEQGDRETFVKLNPFLALLVEATSKRRPHRPAKRTP